VLWLAALLSAVLAVRMAAPAAAAPSNWTVALAATATLPVAPVRLADVTTLPVPQGAGRIVLAAAGRPGDSFTLDRRLVLRKLVMAGLSAGVRMQGAEECRVTFAGRTVGVAAIKSRLQELVQPLLPTAAAGAPPHWCEVQIPDVELTAEDGWRLELVRPHALQPGRNLLTVQIRDHGRATRLSATIICHVFGEVGRARHRIAADEELVPDLFTWEWLDLSRAAHGVVVGREQLLARSARRPIETGALLREADLKGTPLVRQGQPVELLLRRGSVQLTIRATARQEGQRGQTITVRNILTGKLVTARVVGPGLVVWGR
jgi:flagella basal body P-ring formation protein FlgA